MHPLSPSPTPSPTPSSQNSIYPIGSEVEVRHKEDGFKGGWFAATVVDPPAFLLDPSQHQLVHKIFVEHKHLLNRNGSGPLRGFVDLSNVRPMPPPFHINDIIFKENDVVDAFFDHGWWTGIINQILVFPDKSKQYRVFFNDPPRWMQFSHSDLRLHMFCIHGKWFLSSNGSIRIYPNPSKDSNNVIDLTGGDDADMKDDISHVPSDISYFGPSHLLSHNEVSTNLVDLTGCNDSHLHDGGGELNVTSGALVEVNFDSFDSQDIWVPATFIKRNGDGFFLVEYYCSGQLGPVKVVVDSLHIRPTPPPSSRKRFNLLEKVDAFYDSCWLNGVVTQVLPEERYIVYCKSTKKETEVHHKDLRPHVEWAGGKWVPSSLSQDYSPSPNPETLDHACSNGYKDVHVSPEPTGITKDNVGEHTLSTITLKSWLRVMQNSDSENANCYDAMPSNERSKGTSVNGDSICLMPSNQLKEKTVTDVTKTSKDRTIILEQSEVPNKRALIDVAKYSSLQSKDGDQPSTSIENKDNCKKSLSRRKRGRPPRKVQAFAPEAGNETPDENDVVSPCDSLVILRSMYADHMIPSPSASLMQNMNDGKGHSNTCSGHDNMDNEPHRSGEVTNLKRQREFRKESNDFGGDADTLEPTVEPVRIIDLPPTSSLRKTYVMLRYDKMKHPNMQSGTRTYAKRRRKDLNEIFNYKEDKNEPLRHTVMSGRQQKHCQQSDSLPEETASNGVAEVCDSGVAKDMGMVVTRIPVNVSDDSSLGRPHYPPPTDGWHAGQCVETGEKQYKGKKQLTDQPVEKAKEKMDIETPVQFSFEDDNALHRLDDTPMKSNATVERNNKELPFVKKSHIWEMIESMEVFKRFPQCPHFGPLYEFKEECREGSAIGYMVTFTSLVDKVSGLKLGDPRSLLNGYLEALVDLEQMGFNVVGVRDHLKSLAAIKDRHEETQKTYIGIEREIKEEKCWKSRINEEISEVEEKMEEFNQERSLLVGKKQMKDSAIQLLRTGVDDIKMSLQRAEEEFAEVAASPW